MNEVKDIVQNFGEQVLRIIVSMEVRIVVRVVVKLMMRVVVNVGMRVVERQNIDLAGFADRWIHRLGVISLENNIGFLQFCLFLHLSP